MINCIKKIRKGDEVNFKISSDVFIKAYFVSKVFQEGISASNYDFILGLKESQPWFWNAEARNYIERDWGVTNIKVIRESGFIFVRFIRAEQIINIIKKNKNMNNKKGNKMTKEEYVDLLETTVEVLYSDAISNGDINRMRLAASGFNAILAMNPDKVKIGGIEDMRNRSSLSPAQEMMGLKKKLIRIGQISMT